jgi:hypothetical protein
MAFKIDFLPAKYGDCIWIEYGEPGNIHRILIDGGTKGTRAAIKERLALLPEQERKFELIVVTHIDRDHLEGILGLLEDDQLAFKTGGIWFNGWRHMPTDEEIEAMEDFGAEQGEHLTGRILSHQLKWNKQFGEKAVVIPHDGDLPVINLPGGMKITLLSPNPEQLADLKGAWQKEVVDKGLEPGFGEDEIDEDIEHFGLDTPDVEELCEMEFDEDKAEANGSSIAFLANYDGKSAIFLGDSYPGVIHTSLTKLFGNGKVPLDLVKISHHASAGNTSPDLIKKLKCKKWVISTNGSIYKHPAQVTVARMVKFGGNPELIFNYKTQYNKVWDSDLLRLQYNYTTTYPETEGVSVSL